MNQGILLALASMLSNSGYDISMQQNAQRVKGDRNKFLLILSCVTMLIGLVISTVSGIDLLRPVNLIYGVVCGSVAFAGYYAFLVSMYGQNRSVYIIIIRLSFILSIVFSFIFLGDQPNVFKILALASCCGAMLLLSLSESSINNTGDDKRKLSFKGVFKDKYFLAAIVGCLFLATLNTVNKYAALADVDSVAVLFWRYVTFALILLFIIAKRRIQNKRKGFVPPLLATPKKLQFFLYAALGGVMIFIGIVAMIEAMKNYDVSIILPISQLSFVTTMFFNKFFYKEKMTFIKYAGAAVAFLSIIIVSFQ